MFEDSGCFVDFGVSSPSNGRNTCFGGLMGRILDCAQEYLDRRDRLSHPKGSFDSAKRFYLGNHFRCCAGIRSPSRAYPFSQIKHGRSLPHVAHEFGVEEHIAVVRKVASALDKHGKSAAIELLNSPKVKRTLIERDFDV